MGKVAYCKQGGKPTVTYSFKDGKEINFKPKRKLEGEIEIETKSFPVESSENRNNNDGFEITFYFYYTDVTPAKRILLDYKLIPTPGLATNTTLITWECGQNKWETVRYPFDERRGILNTDFSKKCPQSSKDRCSIVVFHKGIIIHAAQGDCPINYEVRCGNCKDGEIECKTEHYPGYCCHDCKSKAEEIRRLRGTIRRLGL